MVFKKPHLFNEVNSWLQIKTKVNELPLDSFTLILFLLQDEHLPEEKVLAWEGEMN